MRQMAQGALLGTLNDLNDLSELNWSNDLWEFRDASVAWLADLPGGQWHLEPSPKLSAHY